MFAEFKAQTGERAYCELSHGTRDVMFNVGEVFTNVGAAAGILSAGWLITQYALQRRVAVKLFVKPERRDEDGIRIDVRNKSQARSIQVIGVEVLHRRGFLRRPVAVAAGPFVTPETPVVLKPDEQRDLWVPLSGVDGANKGPGEPLWDFSQPVKVRIKLSTRRHPTSRALKVK